MLGFLSLGLIWFFWINLVFWFNLGFITLEGVVFPPMPDRQTAESNTHVTSSRSEQKSNVGKRSQREGRVTRVT